MSQLLAILDIVLSLLRHQVNGTPLEQGVTISSAAVRIAQAASSIYEELEGKPLDESLIRPAERL
jgi:hypothetical protein